MLRYLVFILVFLIPLRNVVLKVPDSGIPGLNITHVLYLLVLIGCLVKRQGRGREISRHKSKLTIPIIIYVMYFFIETFVAPTDYLTRNQLLAAWKDRFLLGPILYFVIVKAMQQRKDIYTLLMVMCLANIYIATFFYRLFRWLNLDSFADKI